MKRYPGIDYEQRPASYLEEDDVLASLLRNVKGTKRREMIRDYWETGRLEEVDAELLRDAVAAETRERLSKIHPVFMGGEYLPGYHAGEVEIARIELQSTTADVISIRARRRAEGIRYRIVDEYNTEFELERKSSRKPLSLAEMVEFIEGSQHPDLEGGLGLCFNDMNAAELDRRRLRHFSRVSSEFYPQLEEHYERVYDEWVAEGERVQGGERGKGGQVDEKRAGGPL